MGFWDMFRLTDREATEAEKTLDAVGADLERDTIASATMPYPPVQVRAASPDVIAPAVMVRYMDQMGFGRHDEITHEDVRANYHGLIYSFLNYRAAELSSHFIRTKVQGRRGQDEWEDVGVDHPWVRLLARPNPNIAPLAFWNWAFQAYDAWGHADFLVERRTIEIERARFRVPAILYPIYPEFGKVRPRINATGTVVGYNYWRVDGQHPVPFELTEILRVERPHPVSPGRTASLLEASAFEIDTELASAIYARDSAQQRGRPDVMLETDEEMDPADLRRLGSDFAKQYAIDRIQRVPISHAGLRIKPFVLNQRDMQFIESRTFTQSRLFQIWNQQEGLFSDKANRANADAARYAWALFTIKPTLEGFGNQMEFGLERIFRADPASIRLLMHDPVPVDAKQQAEIDEIRLRTGRVKPSELRARDGLSDDDEGSDQLFISAGLVPLSTAGLGL